MTKPNDFVRSTIPSNDSPVPYEAPTIALKPLPHPSPVATPTEIPMHGNDKFPPVWNPEPVKLVVVEQPEPDEDEERQDFLAAIRAAKDNDTELITDFPNDGRWHPCSTWLDSR